MDFPPMNDPSFDDRPKEPDESYSAWLNAEAIKARQTEPWGANVVEIFPGAGEVHQEGERSPPPLIRASDLLARQMKPRPWIVQDVIPGKQVCELRGDGGTGKSTLALQLCAAAVTGRSWLGMPVGQGPAIYLAAEDDADEVQRRLDVIATHLRVEREALDDLHVWPLATDDPALVAPGEDGYGPTDRWRELEAHVETVRPTVIVLDSRADVFGGEEINRRQVRAFVGMLRELAVRTGAAVIILAHPSVAGLQNRSGNSGSTHWTNAVRAALNFRKLDEVGADPDLRKLEVVKNNYARGTAATTLRWSAGVFVLADSGTPVNTSREEAEAEIDRLFLELLARSEASGRRVSDAPSAANYAPKIFAGDQGVVDRGVSRKGLERAMSRLFNDGKLKVINEGSPSRMVKKIIAVPESEK